MNKTDWYRNTVWNRRTRAEFHRRLQRSRTAFHKAQYLRIQAFYLIQAGLYEPAIELLDVHLRDYPEEDPTQAHQHYAQALSGLNKSDEAILHFRIAIQRERVFRNVITTASLDLARCILASKRSDLFAEALEELTNFETKRHQLFPYEKYEVNGLRAIILDLSGKPSEARLYAQIAIDASEAVHSGFRNHPKLGLVENEKSRFHEQLEELAAA